jgi:hypothetical protein
VTRVKVLAAAAFLFLSGLAPPAEAGRDGVQQPPVIRHERVRVFLDCNSCDTDYLRREIEFIDYVRERKEADLHILVTTQGTGSGGTEYVFQFIGLGRFQGVDDQLKYSSTQTETRDERRAGYTRVLKLGLVRYVTSSSLSDRLHLVYKGEATEVENAVPQKDPWNFWVFRTRANASFSGEESSQNRNFSGSFSGNRVTEAWKVNTSVNLNFRENHYTLSEGDELVDKSHDHSASVVIIKSLTDHWSAAARGRVASTTFLNQDRSMRAAAGVEYSFFPYRASATKELTAQLTVGINNFDYTETTIYDKNNETVGDALFVTSFDLTQPWGTTDVTFETLTYFHDPGRHRMELDGSLDVRLFKGFSLNLGGSISRIRDQLYLQKGDATDEEILLRRRQLATDYRYRFSMGFSYTFGSIYNNIVNTRF